MFFPVIYGVNSPQLEFNIPALKLKNKWCTRNIVAFSNRPFVDDRTDEEKQRAIEVRERRSREIELERERERMRPIREAEHGRDRLNFDWLQKNLPDMCPKSITGYRRMKSTNSKNFQRLCEEAKKYGKDLLE